MHSQDRCQVKNTAKRENGHPFTNFRLSRLSILHDFCVELEEGIIRDIEDPSHWNLDFIDLLLLLSLDKFQTRVRYVITIVGNFTPSIITTWDNDQKPLSFGTRVNQIAMGLSFGEVRSVVGGFPLREHGRHLSGHTFSSKRSNVVDSTRCTVNGNCLSRYSISLRFRCHWLLKLAHATQCTCQFWPFHAKVQSCPFDKMQSER